jgi:transposase
VHIDAAGQYAANLERFLRSLPLPTVVSVGEPKRNKDYHKAVSPKRTSDATESYAMARFAVVEKPSPTLPVPDAFYVLREITSRLQGQVKDTTRAINRAHNLLARVFPELATIARDLSAVSILQLLEKYPTPQRMAAARLESLKKIPYLRYPKATAIYEAAKHSVGTLQGEMAALLVQHSVEQIQHCVQAEEQTEQLLLKAYKALPRSGHLQVATILGIGDVTAAVLVAKIISIDRFATPEDLVGYFGIFPEENTSGFDRHGQPVEKGSMQMSAKGSDVVRRYLWNAANSAIQSNPAVRSLYNRLRAKGKRGDVALGHCMRKLLHLVFAVWSTDTPFSETHYPWEPSHAEDAEPVVTAEAGVPDQVPVTTEAIIDPPSLPVQTTPQGAILEMAAESNGNGKKMAAGHKRETSPEKKVVTATYFSVEPPTVAVNSKRGTIDYAFIREQVTMRQVLQHLGYLDRMRGRDCDLRGPCPIHGSQSPTSRSFSANLTKNVFSCHSSCCRAHGNVLDLWAAVHKLPLYDAACHLADTFHASLKRGNRREEAPVTRR